MHRSFKEMDGNNWKKALVNISGHQILAKKCNVVLSAHNDIFGEIFRDLDRLKSGDEITIYTNQRAYTYVVSDNQVVEPTQVEFMEDTSQPTVTLISCYPYLVDDQRIAVTGRLQTSNN